MDGVFKFFATLMSSLSRGIPVETVLLPVPER